MPSKAQPPPDLFVPSSAHVALAIVIIKAKPPGISARGQHSPAFSTVVFDSPEHVLQLRDQLRAESPGSGCHEHSNYLDLVAYWKEQCRSLQNECDNLRSENIKLERSNHHLTSLTNHISEPVPANAMNTSKRKARATSPMRTVKRPKAGQQAELSVAETQDGIDDDMDFLDGLGQGRPHPC